MKQIADSCSLAIDGGCRHVYLAGLVDAIDQHLVAVNRERDQLAALLGWPLSHQCRSTICSSRWNKDTAGSEAGGKEPHRSGIRKDDAGASRQTNRRSD